MNILFSFFYLLHHLNFSSPFQRFLKIFNDYIFSHTWQTKAIIDHSKEAPTLTHYQVFLNFIHISASPWLSRTDPCFPFLSARALATVWKLTTGEKGLQPNLFCDLVMVSMVIMSHVSDYHAVLPDHQPVHRAVTQTHDGVPLLPLSAKNIFLKMNII